MGRVTDKLKEHLESILKQPELIHNKSFMMGFVSDFRDELPPFDDYMTHKFELETISFIACTASAIKAVPLQMLWKELFQPTDQDNKESTGLLEELAVTAAQAWIDELIDPKKPTWQFMSESEGEYSYDHSANKLKEALFDMVAVNHLAESSFAGAMAQVQVYGWIGMANVAAISDLARNGYLDQSVTSGDLSNGTCIGLFHGLPEELQITVFMATIEMAPDT